MAAAKKPAAKQPIPPNKKAKNMVTSNIPSLIPPKSKPEKTRRTEPTRSYESAMGNRRMQTPQAIKSFSDKHFGPSTKKKK